MIKLMKTILSKIWWLGRGTATMMGVVVMLALTVGLDSTALAGTGVGARFDLGKINKVNAVSAKLVSVNRDLRNQQRNALDPTHFTEIS